KQAADEGPDSMTALHTLPVSAQANAYEVRVTPKPESPIDAREDGMSRFSELRLQIPAQANAHQVRVTPEPKPTRDSRSDGMAAPHASPVSAQPAVIPAQAGIQATLGSRLRGSDGVSGLGSRLHGSDGVSGLGLPLRASDEAVVASGSRCGGADILQRSLSSRCRA